MSRQLISINKLANKCGYFECGELNNGYGCTHPENTEAPGCCYTFACPVAKVMSKKEVCRLENSKGISKKNKSYAR